MTSAGEAEFVVIVTLPVRAGEARGAYVDIPEMV
jgi:hypothetical protein